MFESSRCQKMHRQKSEMNKAWSKALKQDADTRTLKDESETCQAVTSAVAVDSAGLQTIASIACHGA